MPRYSLIPNEHQGGRNEPVFIAGDVPPAGLTRLGAPKVDFLIRGVAQLRPGSSVLELFGGTGLSTALIARQLGRTERLVSVDLHYAPFSTAGDSSSMGGSWHYCTRENYRALAALHRAPIEPWPLFLAADAGRLPLADSLFDVVLAPDAPRTRFDASGIEVELNPAEQRTLFERAVVEAQRVLKPGGLFAATAPRSWLECWSAFEMVAPPSPRQRFKDADDPVVYARARG